MKYIIDLPEQITISDGVISMTGNVGWSVIEKAVHKAVPTRHADEQGEGLREAVISKCEALIKECKDGNSTFDSGATRAAQSVLWEVLNFKSPTPDKAVEPKERLYTASEVEKKIQQALLEKEYEDKIVLAKDTEPLAVLADRKGMKINTSRPKKEWAIGIRRKGVGTDKKGPVEVFKNPTYALAEAKARAYLEALPDKEAK